MATHEEHTATVDQTLIELPRPIQQAIDDHFEKRSRELRDQIVERILHAAKCADDAEAQALELTMCKADYVHFVNTWVWTFNETHVGIGLPADVPFILRPRQVEFLHFIDDCVTGRKNGLVEKSREEGATYLYCAYALWRRLFFDGFNTTIGANKLELVDTLGNMNAIMPKFRYMLYRLPPWMLPSRFSPRLHDNHKRIKNPNRNSIVVGVGGAEMGRGGRSSMFIIDEHAFVKKARQVDRAVSANSPTVIYVSTPNGVGNLFYSKRFSQKIPVFTMFWKDNPDKNYAITYTNPSTGDPETVFPWYYDQCATKDPITIAQEIDLDYSASLEGVIIPGAWVRAAIGLEFPDLNLDEAGFHYGALDVGEGTAEHVFGERKGPVLVFMRGWRSPDPLDAYHFSSRHCRREKVEFFRFDRVGPGSTGAGTFTRWKTTDDERVKNKQIAPEEHRVPFEWEGYNGGATPSKIKYPDDPETQARSRFTNRKAEDMWSLRQRFYRTWQHVNGVVKHREETLISIPNDPTLIAQLSIVRYFTDESGMLRVEKKTELQQRGVPSPDRAEMLYMLFSSWQKPAPQFFF